MWQEVKAMCHSDGDWGPAHEEDRLGRYAGPGFDRVSQGEQRLCACKCVCVCMRVCEPC